MSTYQEGPWDPHQGAGASPYGGPVEPDVLGRRIAAALIDVVVQIVLFVVFALLIGDSSSGDGGVSISLNGLPAVIFFAVSFGYYWLLEAMWGQTLGKRICAIRVMAADGSSPSGGAVFLRNLLRPIDALPLLYLIGFVVTLATGSKRQRLGDLAAQTRVVAVRR